MTEAGRAADVNYELAALSYPLPEDIERAKYAGALSFACELIEARLDDPRIPDCLKQRLLLEREIIKRLPAAYPYRREEALSMLKERFRDFQDAELSALLSQNALEWIYIDGELRFHAQFLENLLKVRRDFRNRDLKQDNAKDQNRALLCENMLRMKTDLCRCVHIHLRTTIRLTENGRKKCSGKRIRVYLPLPVEYAQVKNYRLHAISPKPLLVAGPEYPQRTAVFEAEVSGEETFSAEFSFDNVLEYRAPKPEAVLPAQPNFYTHEEAPHIRFTPYIRSLAEEIVGDEKNPLLKARRIYDYITTHVCYSFVRPYSTFANIPEFAGNSLKGDCGFQALLFIALCRASGVPARWQSGLYATPGYVGSHDWAQYYVAPYGWLFADCSFGGAAYRQEDEERRVFYGANLDPYRVPQASEFQHGFILPEGALRFDPYDNQAGEIICGGEALSAYGGDFETVYDLIELREVY